MEIRKAHLAAEPTGASAEEVAGNVVQKRVRPDRAGQRLVAAHFDAETFKSFKILCAEQGMTTQAMVSKAMQLLFKEHNKPINEMLKLQAENKN